jgi:group II intron reverse transcriptase/maturase
MLGLIRRYLSAGVLADGVVLERHEGTPQGGPLSPLLANVLLDEVDKELEKRGHAFVRYADDCNVYVGSRRAGERVMEMLRGLYAGLHLRVNEAKSAVARARDRKFLGFSFWLSRGKEVRLRVAPKAQEAMKDRVREITTRSGGRSMRTVVAELRTYLVGWKQYFQLAQTPSIFARHDAWIRRRLRALQLKQWKRGTTAYRELRKLGVSDFWSRMVASAMHRLYWNSNTHAAVALPNSHFDRLGVPRLAP